jgi:membrane-associated phospholipid phosphatase
LLGILTWQVIAAGPLTAADMPVHRWVQGHGLDRSSALWVPLGDLGDGRFVVPVLVAVAVVVGWRLRRLAVRPLLLAGAGLAVFTAVLEVTKTATGRADPDSGSYAVFAGGTEFPSGHTFGATVLWGLIAWLMVLAAGVRPALGAVEDPGRSRVSRSACLLAGGVAGVLSAAAMVRMDYHWVSDVVGGWLLGMIALLAVVAAEDASRLLHSRRALLHRNVRPPGRDEFTPEPPRLGRSSQLLPGSAAADRATRPPRARGGPRSRRP